MRVYTICGSMSPPVDVSKQDAGQLWYQFMLDARAQVGRSERRWATDGSVLSADLTQNIRKT